MPLSQDPRPVNRVTNDIIRQYFNQSQVLDQVQNGYLNAVITKDNHLDDPPPSEPFCTHSQILWYYTRDGDPVAVVHQYLRPDGTLGGCGLPDPKRLYLADRILYVSHSDD